MPDKRDSYRTYGEKLISLFWKLLYSNESHSLTELSRMLNCSKQSVLRLVRDIQKSYGVNIEETMQGNRKYYRLQRRLLPPVVNLTHTEMSVLQMCRSFTEHLLGRELFEEATRALDKSKAFLVRDEIPSSKHFGSFRPGSIDYTPHHETIRTLIEAMDNKKICKISYKRPMAKNAKTYFSKPLKIFSHHDTIYLHVRMAKQPGKPYREPDFDPLLAVHRIVSVELTDKPFVFPKDYDFDKVFNLNFGIIKDEAFKVEAEFSGYSAAYVSERYWSPDQKIVRKRDGKIKLSFSTSSDPEIIAWLLSFGDEVRLLKPKWLVDEVREIVKRVIKVNV
jgi:predicted DNA-binding transcriptional regulator YafY